jgi:hypothetical protein
VWMLNLLRYHFEIEPGVDDFVDVLTDNDTRDQESGHLEIKEMEYSP